MQVHQQRVIDELADLEEKRGKLQTFLSGELFKTLPLRMQDQLTRQESLMQQYAGILKERIEDF